MFKLITKYLFMCPLISHIKFDIKCYINFLGGTDNQTILKLKQLLESL